MSKLKLLLSLSRVFRVCVFTFVLVAVVGTIPVYANPTHKTKSLAHAILGSTTTRSALATVDATRDSSLEKAKKAGRLVVKAGYNLAKVRVIYGLSRAIGLMIKNGVLGNGELSFSYSWLEGLLPEAMHGIIQDGISEGVLLLSGDKLSLCDDCLTLFGTGGVSFCLPVILFLLESIYVDIVSSKKKIDQKSSKFKKVAKTLGNMWGMAVLGIISVVGFSGKDTRKKAVIVAISVIALGENIYKIWKRPNVEAKLSISKAV